MATISKIGRDASNDPRIRRLAVSIFRANGIAPRNYRGQAAAILKALQDGVYFVNEGDGRGGGEVLQDPLYTLDLQPDGSIGPRAAGDCDDFASTYLALCESVHLSVRLVTSGRAADGRRVRWIEGVGASPSGVAWSHIYCCVASRPFGMKRYNDRLWSFADGTVQGVPLGWDCIDNGQSDPQLGDSSLLAPVERIGGLSLRTAATLVGVSVVSAVLIGRLRRAGWV
ncbi:MAG: hypothetical protein Q8P18_33240 [Pseudomonadota bacterium]|nr:hypothetical protein [Pseudomonadota bacterium]